MTNNSKCKKYQKILNFTFNIDQVSIINCMTDIKYIIMDGIRPPPKRY